MMFRRLRRAVALGTEIILCIIRFQLLRLGGPRTLERRALLDSANGARDAGESGYYL